MGRSCLKKQRYAYLLAAALTVILTVEAFASGGEEEQGRFYATAFSLLPPVAAIVLALVTKEVYTSLMAGILVGGLLAADFHPVVAVTRSFDTMVESVGDNMGILIFLVILGIIVVLMNGSGGSDAYGQWAGSSSRPNGARCCPP